MILKAASVDYNTASRLVNSKTVSRDPFFASTAFVAIKIVVKNILFEKVANLGGRI